MMGVLRTFGHLVILGIFVLLILAIIMAIPGTRHWTLGQAGRAVDLAGPSEIATLVESAVYNLDPESIAEVVNDPDSRECLVNMITELLPELDHESLANLVNEILENPEVANLIIDIIPEIDESAMGNFVNQIVADQPYMIYPVFLNIPCNEIYFGICNKDTPDAVGFL